MSASFKNLKTFKPQPNASRLIDHLLGRTQVNPPPMIEFIVDEPIMREVLTLWLDCPWVPYGNDRDSQMKYLDNVITFWHSMGYDVLRFEAALPFPGLSRISTLGKALQQGVGLKRTKG